MNIEGNDLSINTNEGKDWCKNYDDKLERGEVNKEPSKGLGVYTDHSDGELYLENNMTLSK